MRAATGRTLAGGSGTVACPAMKVSALGFHSEQFLITSTSVGNTTPFVPRVIASIEPSLRSHWLPDPNDDAKARSVRPGTISSKSRSQSTGSGASDCPTSARAVGRAIVSRSSDSSSIAQRGGRTSTSAPRMPQTVGTTGGTYGRETSAQMRSLVSVSLTATYCVSVQTVRFAQRRLIVRSGMRVVYCSCEHCVQAVQTTPSPYQPGLHSHSRSGPTVSFFATPCTGSQTVFRAQRRSTMAVGRAY